MLHLLRSAVARPSAARVAPAPADRLAQLVVPAGGWLPPAPVEDPHLWPADAVAGRSGGPADEAEGEWPGQWPHESPDGPADDLDGPSDDLDDGPSDDLDDGPQRRSWAPAGRHASESEQRWRLDVGRSAVGALLLVALLATVVAAGVVLRGRPQEVAAPVVEARAAVRAEDHHADEGTAGDTGAPTVDATGAPLPQERGAAQRSGAHVVVAVAGKVRTPGLVRLPVGSRVDDAVKAAGGPVDPAAVGLLNLARVLVDGEQVLVGVEPPPGSAPAGAPPGAPPGAGAGGGPLDLNAATASDLDALPGIGPVLAQRIVDWRTENGRFASVDQLREVTGIGEAKYQDLVAEVVV